MKKVMYIPIDSRPCNTTWIEKFAKRAQLNLLMYPKEKSGDLHNKADVNDIYKWIDHNINTVDHVIIALDMLNSGGLVPSRKGNFDVEETKQRLNVFEKYKKRNPNLKIFAFDTIMRVAITVYDYKSQILWNQVNQYSKLKGDIEINKNLESVPKLEKLINEINSDDLDGFLRSRNNKHQLNLHHINLIKEGIFDYLLILQEDSHQNGIQILEQNILVNEIKNLKLSNKVKLYNGTDEGGATLLAKTILEIYNLQPKIHVHATNTKYLENILHFEDRPFINNLNNMFDVINYKSTNLVESDYVLAIHAIRDIINLPLSKFEDMPLDKNEEYIEFIDKINLYIKQDRKVALLDLMFPNGGHPDVVKDINYQELKGYSAWNTPSNSLGSLLCDMACYMVNNTKNSFLQERILDDLIYQYYVRRIVNERIIKDQVNIFDLGKDGMSVLNEIKQVFKKYDNIVKFKKYNIYLPWNRTFEIDIDVEV